MTTKEGRAFRQKEENEHYKQELQAAKEEEHPKALCAELVLEGLSDDEGHEHIQGGIDG